MNIDLELINKLKEQKILPIINGESKKLRIMHINN